MNLGVDELEESITSPALNRTKNKSLRKSVAVEDDDDDGVEMGRAAQGRLSMASRKSVNGVIDPTADTDDEQASEMGEPSFRFDETAHVGADTTFGIGDDMDRNSEELEGVEELEDASLEEAALAAEEGSEGEDGQVAPSREREKHLRPAVKKRKKLVDPPRAVITKRRTRLSRLENGTFQAYTVHFQRILTMSSQVIPMAFTVTSSVADPVDCISSRSLTGEAKNSSISVVYTFRSSRR